MKRTLLNDYNFYVIRPNSATSVFWRFLKKTVNNKKTNPFAVGLILLFCITQVNANIYYVSSTSGNDANLGTSINQAWKTLDKVNSTALKPGDQILFKSGDVWSGTLNVKVSGISGNPIVYSAYGTGNKPIISGLISVTEWTYKGGNIWESTNAVSSLTNCNMVVINGVNTPMGKTPNSGYYYFQSHSDNYHITSSDLNGTQNWAGAELAFNINNWETKRCPITAQSSMTLTFKQPESFTIRENGLKLIIQNDIRTLDKQNEWYYSPSTKKISIYSTSEPTGVNIASIDILVNLYDKDYITFQNIKFEGSNQKSFNIERSNSIIINNCDFDYSGLHGIYGGGFSVASNNLTVTNCSFNHSNNGAIGVTQYFTNANISNNIINNSGMIFGASETYTTGTNNSGVLYGISAQGPGSIIEYNTVNNSGYIGIRYRGSNTSVRYNFVKDFCQINHDGGGIYTYNATGTPYSGTKVYNNIVINNSTVKEAGHTITDDAGIYLDGLTNGIEIRANSVEVPLGNGIRVNGSYDVDINNNNIFNCLEGIRFRRDYISNVSAMYNTIVARTGDQYIYRVFPSESVIKSITADYNTIGRPINPTEIIWTFEETPTPKTDYQTLGEWQSYSKHDLNSKTTSVSLTSESDIQLLYNNTKLAKTIDLGGSTYKDIEGNTISGSLTLESFTSRILIKSSSISPTDVTAPIITNFSIPATSISLTVPISSFTATDNIEVSGYIVTESASVPNANDAGWTTSPPSIYTFASEGTKTLYAWVMDKSGNISSAVSAHLIITLSIENANTLGNTDVYSSTAASTNCRAIPVTFTEDGTIQSVSIYHNGGTGNMLLGVYSDKSGYPNSILGITPVTPVSGTEDWQTISLTSPVSVHSGETIWLAWIFENSVRVRYTVGAPGRAQSGDTWSSGMSATFGTSTLGTTKFSIYCNYLPVSAMSDSIEPSVTAFNIPTTASSLIVPITSFTATDNNAVTGFKLTEFATAPSAGDEDWTITAPTLYTFSSEGTKILYAWVKDEAGNVSTGASAKVIITLPKTVYSKESITICDGNTYEGWTTDGIYERTLKATSGADSIVTTYLTVNPTYNVTENISIKEGENYNGWISAGEYSRNLSSIFGCDSTVTTYLAVIKPIKTVEDVSICEGNTYNGWSENGTYQRTLLSSTGADSIVTTNLIVNPTYNNYEDISIKEGTNYHGWTEPGTYERNLTSIYGCDSIVTTNLLVIQAKLTYENVDICEGESYLSWSTTGQYERLLKTVSGADSIVITKLWVHPVYDIVEDQTIYEGESYMGWTEAGTYQRNLQTIYGCDSLVMTNLEVIQAIIVYEDVDICEGSSYLGWTLPGQYQRILKAKSGGDSIVITNLWVNPTYDVTEEIFINDGENYLGWTTTGEYQRSLTSIFGCDSLVTTLLTVVANTNQPDYSTSNESTQLISLKKGWNIFSANVVPANANMDNLMAQLVQQGYLLMVLDENGNSYENSNSGMGWNNNIGELQTTEGYEIQVNANCVLSITGTSMDMPIDIDLAKGWNIISFPFNGTVDALQVFQPLIDSGKLDKVLDEKGNSIEYWRNRGWVNKIGNLEAGEGYKILVNAAAMLQINNVNQKTSIITLGKLKTEHFNAEFFENGFCHMNINLLGLNETNLNKGDEVAIFDGSLCVGAYKISNADIKNNALSIPTSASDYNMINGFNEGNAITIRYWNAATNSEYEKNPFVIEGNLSFHKLSSVFIVLDDQTTSATNIFDDIDLELYPNPVTTKFTVRFSRLPEGETEMVLLDMSGRQIENRNAISNYEVFDVQALPSGIYVLKTFIGNDVDTKKVIIN